MIKWTFKINEEQALVKLEFVIDIIEMRTHLSYQHTPNDEDINEYNIKDFQEIWNVWLDRWENDEEFPVGNSNIFGAVSMALVRRTFPTLFANQFCNVQPMKTPIGLAYSMRVIYNQDDEPQDEVM